MASRGPRANKRRGVYLLPSLLTTGNLFAGYYSIVATLHGEYRAAAMAIGIAIVLDGLDGRIARMTNTQSEFGAVYDSLADVIAFGAAPGLLVLSWGLWDLGRVGWTVSFFYLVCATMRLARFSIPGGASGRRYFVGYPSPASAGLLAALAFYGPDRLESRFGAQLLVLAVLVAALLMVSKFRYRSFKDFDLRQRQPQAVLVFLAMVISLIALDPENVLLLVAAAYALAGPLGHALGRGTAKDPAAEPGTENPAEQEVSGQ